MKIKIKLNKNSAFNSEEHFFHSLEDLITEWEECIGAKEMDVHDAGFNCERLRELKQSIINCLDKRN
tara:strand:+ start:45 stop:245 length:201 start_codon:yes stop_codon:yes gene_type:complete